MFGKVVDTRPEILPVEEQGAKDRKLQKTCEELESVFTYQLLRSMRRTVEKCDLFHGGSGEEVYESLLDQELSKSMTGMGKRGLADLLYQQLRRKDAPYKVGEAPPLPSSAADPGQPLWPLRGRISSEFGWRTDPITGDRRYHEGLDVAAARGTPISATLPGRIVRSEFQEGYGNVVEVDHGRGYTTRYAHNRENLVREGDWVRAGDPVARVGSTGRSTGNHLHFEVRRHGRPLNPVEFLGARTTVDVAGSSSGDLSPSAG